jgi:hypothetical protein
MNKLLGWVTLGKIIVSSLVSLIVFFVLMQHDWFYKIYSSREFFLINSLLYLRILLLFFSGLLIPSFLCLFKKSNFLLWRKTIIFYFFIYLIIVIFTPWNAGDVYFRIAKDLFALYWVVFYNIFSVFFIFFKKEK